MLPGHTGSDISLQDNSKCEIDNPLSRWTLEQLDANSRAFANEVYQGRPTKDQLQLFVKAARVGRYGWKHYSKLSEEERDAFRLKTFLEQPKVLKVTILMLSLSAIVQGWLQTVSNAANQSWPEALSIYSSKDDSWYGNSRGRWIYASVNAITYLSASVIGCWLSDPLQLIPVRKFKEKRTNVGRRGAIFISGCVCLAASIGAACSRDWKQLLICRALVGVGMGAKAAVTPIFGAEVSPNNLRGTLVMNWQLFDAFGIFCGFTANLIVPKCNLASWRYQTASVCFPIVSLLTIAFAVPESPRWLLKNGQFQEAFDAMVLLRRDPLLAATEVFYANAQLQAEAGLLHSGFRVGSAEAPSQEGSTIFRFQETVRLTRYWRRFVQLFLDNRTRRATVASGVVMIAQQLCGVNILVFYSSTFLRDDDSVAPSCSQDREALFLSWGLGLSNFLFTIPAYYLVDTRGRLALLLGTYPGMILSMLASCLSFQAKDRDVGRVLLILFAFILFFWYSLGQGPVAFTYASEVFPLANREVGMGFAVFINFLGAGLLTLFVGFASSTPTRPSDQTDLLAAFTACSVVALVLIFLLVPETSYAVNRIPDDQKSLKYMSLEELNFIFGVKTKQHIDYQLRHWLTWMSQYSWWKIKRFANPQFREPAPTKKDLYVWIEQRQTAQDTDEEPEQNLEAVNDSSSSGELDELCGTCGQRVRRRQPNK